jgi:hypothetical protein
MELIINRVVVPYADGPLPKNQMVDGFLCHWVFVEYLYEDFYHPGRKDSSSSIVSSRVYHLTYKIDSEKPFRSLVFNSLLFSPYKNPYIGKPYIISNWYDIIKLLERKPVQFYPETVPLFTTDMKKIYYDLTTDKIFDTSCSSKKCISFARSGGLIETPDVKQLVDKIQGDEGQKIIPEGILVVVPENLKWLWDDRLIDRICVLTQEEILEKKKITVSMYEGYTMIIHELYGKLLPTIKRLATAINTTRILVINYLSLDVYFSEPGSLSFENACRLVNLWANWSVPEKEKYCKELKLFIGNQLGNIILTAEMRSKIDSLPLYPYEPSLTEQTITNYCKSVRDTWLEYLDSKGVSAKKLKSINRNLAAKILSSYHNLLTPEMLNSRFTEMHQSSMNILEKLNEKLGIMEKKYRLVHLTQDEMVRNTVVNLGLFLKTLAKQRQEIKKSLINHQRHLDNLPGNSLDMCNICYETDNLCLTVCNHTLCLECGLQTISHTRTCPICREELTLDRFMIIAPLTGLFHQIPSDTLIVTDLKINHNLGRKIITVHSISANYQKISKSSSVVFLTSADESYLKRFQSRQLISYIQSIHQFLVDIRVILI